MKDDKELSLFQRLYETDVSSFIEEKKVETKKGKTFTLNYLSWAFAHAEMKKIDPDAKVVEREFIHYRLLGEHLIEEKKPWLADQAGAMVNVTVKMLDREENEWLYVMDNSNQSVSDPNAAQINKTLKRCFVKALAKFGLGLSLYVGEDTKAAADKKTEPMTLDKALAYTLTFGKHNGKTLEAVNKEGDGYIKWLANSDKTRPEVKEAASMILNPPKEENSPKKEETNQQDSERNSYEIRDSQLIAELESKVQHVANKTGASVSKLKDFVLKSVNQTNKATHTKFEQVDRGLAVGTLKTLEMKYDQKQADKEKKRKEVEQGSILESHTTNPAAEIFGGN